MVTTQSQLPLATTRGPSENRKNRLSQVLGYPGETLTTHHGTHTHARSFRQRHGSSRLVSVSRQRVVQRRRSTGPLERKFIASSGSMLTKLCSRFQTASTLGGVCECVVFFRGSSGAGAFGGLVWPPDRRRHRVFRWRPAAPVSSLSEQSLGSARALQRAPEPVKSHQSAWHTTDPIRSRSGDGCACPKSRSSSPTRVRDCKREPTDRQTADGRVALPLAKRVQTKCCSQSRGQ